MNNALIYEIFILCLLILFFLLYKINENQQVYNRLCILVLINTTLLCLFDLGCSLAKTDPVLILPHYLCSSLFFIWVGIVPFSWFLYIVFIMYPDYLHKPIYGLVLLPLLLLIGLAVASPWTGSLYTISDQNAYARGPWHFIQILVSYFYTLSAFWLPFHQALREKNYIRRTSLFILASFIIPPSIGGIIEVFYHVPAVCPTITLSMLYIFLTFQSRQISRDPLTQVNMPPAIRLRFSLKQPLSVAIISISRFRPNPDFP